MQQFHLKVPTEIHFGRGALDYLGAQARRYGDVALLISGRDAMRRTGTLRRSVDLLAAAGVRSVLFTGVSPNPRSDEVDRALRVAEQNSCRVVVGLGGGSVLDTAKAVGVAAGRETVRDLIAGDLPGDLTPLPVIAVPTTAGSGAEVTKGAIVTDTVRGLKAGIRGEPLFPRVALLDPVLMETTPLEVTVDAGFDALAHAVEGYVARASGPLNDLLCERALELVVNHLPLIASGAGTAEDWDGMAFASLLGGLSVATASTCLPHRLQQAMGGVSRVSSSHGRGVAMLYSPWLRRAQQHAPARFGALAAVMGESDVVEATERLRNRLRLVGGLQSMGYTESDIPTFVASVVGNLSNDPTEGVNEQLLAEIYLEAM